MKEDTIEWRRKAGFTITVGMDTVNAISEDAAEVVFAATKAATDKIGEYEIIRIYPEE